jgi:hypothetical protein
VTLALAMASELLSQAEAAGLIKDMPEDSELNAPTKRHIERQIRLQIFQQQAAARISQEPDIALRSVPGQITPRRQ